MAALDLPGLVVLDTCVLLFGRLRHVLLGLSAHGCFQPIWSPVIGDEWRRNASRAAGVPAEQAGIWWDEWERDFPAASQPDIAPFKDGLKHSDPKDWHVIAAGRAALSKQPGASAAILTRNIRDFSRSELRRVGLGLFDPDAFLVRCLDRHPVVLTRLLNELAQETAVWSAEPLPDILKRERLFRLNRLLALPEPGESDGKTETM